jgi:hypothetical protein
MAIGRLRATRGSRLAHVPPNGTRTRVEKRAAPTGIYSAERRAMKIQRVTWVALLAAAAAAAATAACSGTTSAIDGNGDASTSDAARDGATQGDASHANDDAGERDAEVIDGSIDASFDAATDAPFDANNDPKCPASEPTAGTGCNGHGLQCAYAPGGSCHHYSCTGAGWLGPAPDCTPGCPHDAPTNGAPCSAVGTHCGGWGDVGRPKCGTQADCTAQGWSVSQVTCPPPPP